MFHKNKIKFIILGILSVSSFLIWSAYFSSRPADKLSVDFFDVGQGDSIMIQTPGRDKILIDGGPDNSILEKIGRVLSFDDRAIRMLIVTHPDSDHLAGAVEVAKDYNIGMILVNGKECATKICGEFAKIIKEKKIKLVVAKPGQKIDFGNGVKMDIFVPPASAAAAGKADDNNFSIISRLAFGADSLLFTGDAEAKEEADLLNFWPNLTAEVLKVGHHGSKNSTGSTLLEKIKPKLSVISVGAKNRYGHPTIEALDRLKKIGSEIFRTDLAGDIKMESEGKGLVIAN